MPRILAWTATVVLCVLLARESAAASLVIPNHSFESPTVAYALPLLNEWQRTPKPDWYNEGGGFEWNQLTGTFKNPAPGASDHIDNCDGNQAMWLFANPEVGIFQDYESIGENHTQPTFAFNEEFTTSRSYKLIAGVIGGGGGMRQGASLRIGLYYRDASSNRVLIASSNVVHSTNLFLSTTHFVDIEISLPSVQESDPWAGKKIGVELVSSITDTNLVGGYWDIDNVRLIESAEPQLRTPAWTNGQFSFALESEPGAALEILSSTNASLPLAQWTSLAIITNSSGTDSFIDTSPDAASRIYRARQIAGP